MRVEFLSWASALLVVPSLIDRIVTAHAVAAQPGRDEADPALEPLPRTARRPADSVRGVLQPQAAPP